MFDLFWGKFVSGSFFAGFESFKVDLASKAPVESVQANPMLEEYTLAVAVLLIGKSDLATKAKNSENHLTTVTIMQSRCAWWLSF